MVIALFVYYNPNPDRKNTTDCTIRALTKALDLTWDEVYAKVSFAGLVLHDMPDKNYVWSKVLKDNGFRRYIIPDTCPDCYTVRDFCVDHRSGTYVLCLDGHVVAVKDGDHYDAWDSGDGVPIFYWERK